MLRQGHPEKFGEGNYYLHSPAEIERHFGALPRAILVSRRPVPKVVYSMRVASFASTSITMKSGAFSINRAFRAWRSSMRA